MASIRKEVLIDTTPEAAWDALRDWGAPHERLVPGFVTQTEIDGTDRIVTFFNGFVARERLVSVDDDQRRLAWSIADGVYEHHNSFAQVLPDGDGRTRFVWITDFLPDDSAERLDGMMERGIGVIGATLGA